MSTSLLGISRAHTELLGIQPQTPYPEPKILEHVLIIDEARYSLIRQMYLTGRWQWGIAFGERDGGLLAITHVAPNAPRFEDPDRPPFKYDARYLLGYADAILSISSGYLDWAGYWLVRPNSQVMSPEEEVVWLRTATTQGVIDSQTPLLTVGYDDGELVIHAYKAIDSDLVRLTVS